MAETTAVHIQSYQPQLFRLNENNEYVKLKELLGSGLIASVYDRIEDQLKELMKGRNASSSLTEEDYSRLIAEHLAGRSLEEYGVWVYYPWAQRLVHVLDEAEYTEVRTNRNKYKITHEEQEQLSQKKIGVIGLSVGQSIALTLAMERGFGELRLADFDVLELGNMNRIRSGVHNLGVPKVIMAAREIAEIDPYLNVTIYPEGITEENIDSFYTKGGKLDILVEECDSLDIKILARHKAREMKIPVVMDTSDRGMIDVERFDLEPDRPLLHGLVGDINPTEVKDLTNEQKIPYVMKMVDIDNISQRLRYSMGEVRKTITTWPQLASGVVMGGAVAADVCRRILLDQYHESGRYYIDPEEQIADKTG